MRAYREGLHADPRVWGYWQHRRLPGPEARTDQAAVVAEAAMRGCHVLLSSSVSDWVLKWKDFRVACVGSFEHQG